MNHFRNNDGYTTKSGLSRNLKNLISKDIDMDGFFPKCYDLYDQQDLEDFLGIYYIFRGVQVLLCAVPDDLIAQGGAE